MPIERRPLDHVLASMNGKPEEEVVAWWKSRFEQIVAIPMASARAGALVPEWRELASMPEAQRVVLTRARLLASMQLTTDQQDKLFEARALGSREVPEVAAADAAFIGEKVVPTLAPDVQQRVKDRPARQ